MIYHICDILHFKHPYDPTENLTTLRSAKRSSSPRRRNLPRVRNRSCWQRWYNARCGVERGSDGKMSGFGESSYMGVEPKIGFFLTPQIVHLFIGFSMKFSPSILGYPYFGKHPFGESSTGKMEGLPKKRWAATGRQTRRLKSKIV